jgi:gluconolactonase
VDHQEVTLETIAWGYGLAEAPRVDAEGNLWFSDVVGGGVYRRLPDGAVETVIPKRRGVGGLLLHADGGVVLSGKEVIHVGATETRVVLRVDGALGFNDMTTDSRGRVYVGSLRSSAFETEARVPGELWRVDGEGAAAEIYGDVEFCNGVGFSPDERTIYHSNYSRAHVLAHDLDDAGRGVNRRIFATLPRGNPDGLAVDESGCVWVAMGSGGAIARFTPSGALDAIVPVPASFVTSLCFGGDDRRDLYVTTADNTEHSERRGTIFRARTDVPGLAVSPARV